MKRLLGNVASVVSLLLIILTLANAAQLKEARVTQVVSDVKLLPQQAAPRPAALNDPVRSGTAVRTGTQSRSELTFADLTITRLGANTIFSFEQGTRTMDLRDGAVLFQVPKGSGGATIRTTAVTAAITGTTGIGEFHPATASHPQPFSKWLCLEGVFHLTLPNGQSVELGPGKMVTTDGNTFSPVMTFNIGLLMEKSLLVNGFDTPLASLALILIEQENQSALLNAGGPGEDLFSLLDPANIIDVVDQAMTAQESPTVTPTPSTPTPTPSTPTPTPSTPTPTPSTPTPTPSTPTPTPSTPTPTPGKFGALTVIASSDPYVITGDTEITTDPSITTNGHTDFGKIYRGQAQDGLLSTFIFGSTSAFDTASGFDAALSQAAMDSAGFKFTSLQLTGNPKISTAGGAVNLGLIAVNGITSGGPGGVLTFAGIQGLLLATQNGSITLGSEISFSGLNSITFYARGTGSMLTLASDVSTTSKIRLYGEGGIELSSDLSTQDLIAYTGGNFDFSAGSIDAETISIIAGGDLIFSPSTPLDIGGNLSLTTRSSDIDSGGIISMTTLGGTTIGGALTLLLDNSNGGHIGSEGNILLRTTTGDLTAGSLVAHIDNHNGGTISGSSTLTLAVSDTLTTLNSVTFNDTEASLFLLISNQADGSGGGTIASDAVINLNAGAVSIGGAAFAEISNMRGGAIGGNAAINVNISRDLTAGDAVFDILNEGAFDGSVNGGTINGNASIIFNAADIAITGPNGFDVSIFNGLGTIGGNAVIRLNAADISLTGAFSEITIDNDNGARIDGDAIMTVNAASLSVVDSSNFGFFFAGISNEGGTIAGMATTTYAISGGLTVQDGEFIIINIFDDELPQNGSGTIGSDAIINLSAANIIASDFFDVDILNTGGSQIIGNATINVDVAGDISGAGTAFFGITNSTDSHSAIPGNIGSDATINLTAANFFAASLFASINNTNGGTIGGNAVIDLGVSGDINTPGNVTVKIHNQGGGIVGDALIDMSANDVSASLDVEMENMGGSTIGSDATITLNVAGITSSASDGSALVAVSNFDGGSIGGSAVLEVDASGDIETQSEVGFSILNNDVFGGGGGTIGSDATIDVSGINVSTAGVLFAQIRNESGGDIGGNATINFHMSGAIDTAEATSFTISNNAGTIGSDARINFSAASVSLAGNPLDFVIDNFDEGQIGGNAAINAIVTGDITTATSIGLAINSSGGSIAGDATLFLAAGNILTDQGTFFPQIFNQDGGVIGGDAAVTINSANITVNGNDGAGASFNSIIFNNGGQINGAAHIHIAASGDVVAQQASSFQILNDDIGSGVGSIGADATILVEAASYSTGAELAAIFGNTDASIGGSASASFDISGTVTSQTSGFFFIFNNGGAIGSDAILGFSAGSASFATDFTQGISNYSGGTITGNARIGLTIAGDLSAGGVIDLSMDSGFAGGLGTIGGDAIIDVSATNMNAGSGLSALLLNYDGAEIGQNAVIDFGISGNITTQSDAAFQIFNSNGPEAGGTIGEDAVVTVSASGITANILAAGIFNTNGEIGGDANISFDLAGAVTAHDSVFDILNDIGDIGGAASVSVMTGGDFSSTTFSEFIYNPGGSIGDDTTVTFNGGGDLTVANGLDISITNDGGQIGGSAAISAITTDDINAGNGFALTISNSPGSIGGDATIFLNAGDILVDQSAFFAQIFNQDGGAIGGNAIIALTAADITVTESDTGSLNSFIFNGDGQIDLTAAVTLIASGDVFAQVDLNFQIINDVKSGSSSIGAAAAISLMANSFSANTFTAAINNVGGTIGQDAFVAVSATDAITVSEGALFEIVNASGTIGGVANISIDAGSLSADSLLVGIDNSQGSIGGSAVVINSNIATTTANNATFFIFGNDGEGPSVININPGDYTIVSNFRSTIDGDGTIAFNNATVHADVLKAGVFGANGVLNIGGGTLSADTTLKLYAPGSSGELNFIDDVTLSGNGAKILAANSVTISDGKTVTILGPTAADVYTTNANYSESSGGNDSTTGMFAGAGANAPQPLDQAPPFDEGRPDPSPAATPKSQSPHQPPSRRPVPHARPPAATHVTSANRHHGDVRSGSSNPTRNVINVRDSDQLLSLLDGTPDANGKVAVPASNNTRGRGSAGRGGGAGRAGNSRAASSANATLYPAKHLP